MNSIMNEAQVLIPVNMDKEEVGHIFENYNLVSAGVVDKDNKLVGMITGDDVFTVLKEEAEEVKEEAENKTNYDDMKVTELKEVLKEMGLPVSGKKADLIERIKECEN